MCRRRLPTAQRMEYRSASSLIGGLFVTPVRKPPVPASVGQEAETTAGQPARHPDTASFLLLFSNLQDTPNGLPPRQLGVVISGGILSRPFVNQNWRKPSGSTIKEIDTNGGEEPAAFCRFLPSNHRGLIPHLNKDQEGGTLKGLHLFNVPF